MTMLVLCICSGWVKREGGGAILVHIEMRIDL